MDNDTGGRDIEVDWQNPSVLYAGMYRGVRKGWDIISGGPADKGGIYKSTDGGDTWKKISAGLPGTLIGKIDLDIARSNPSVHGRSAGNEGGLYRSSDAGESWTNVNSSQRQRARPFYFNYVSVNPKNENEVWVSELGFPSRPTPARRSPPWTRRTATTTACGSTPTTPTSCCR